jgi:protein gp37
MGESKIEWTDYTFNPWIGCTKVSSGCAHCYAERDNKHYNWNPNGWGPGVPRKRTSAANWKQPLKWDREAAISGQRKRVFCASLADVFDPEVDQQWREDLWNLIEQTPNLDWLLLTKRPENIEEMLPDRWSSFGYYELHNTIPDQSPLPWNVWFGISAEDQNNLVIRWDILASWAAHWCPRILFVSLEPLLGPINIAVIDEWYEREEDNVIDLPGCDWVIVGGESGPHARPMHQDWVRSIRDQCLQRELPFHFKQWGEWTSVYPQGLNLANREQIYKSGVTFYRVGKKAAGRLLDDRTWEEYPGFRTTKGAEDE